MSTITPETYCSALYLSYVKEGKLMPVRFSRLIPVKGPVSTTTAALCFLLLFFSSALAAGPSYVTVWMDPVAVNPSGQVLLRTFYRSNQSDGQPLSGSEIRFGWLVVSAQGLWKEYGHFSMKETEGGAAGDNSQQALFDRHMNEFEAPFDWNSPPASIQPILTTYKFAKAYASDPRLGKGGVTWTPKGIYSKKKLLERDAGQLTLGRKSSLRGAGSEIEAAFFTRGVALFRNEGKPETEKRGAARGAKGAVFRLSGAMPGDKNFSIRDAGVDVWEVDGICLLKTQQTPQQKKQKKSQGSKTKARQ
jgi:hypothetical protein